MSVLWSLFRIGSNLSFWLVGFGFWCGKCQCLVYQRPRRFLGYILRHALSTQQRISISSCLSTKRISLSNSPVSLLQIRFCYRGDSRSSCNSVDAKSRLDNKEEKFHLPFFSKMGWRKREEEGLFHGMKGQWFRESKSIHEDRVKACDFFSFSTELIDAHKMLV